VEVVLTAVKEFEISFYFCQNLKKKTRVPRYKKGKSIFIMFVSLQFSLQLLSSDKSFVCRTFQATNNDKLIITRFVLYYF
jgi:23S rRNA U2552 (ribose-2'-O)-methylase RlmE/FtsJ